MRNRIVLVLAVVFVGFSALADVTAWHSYGPALVKDGIDVLYAENAVALAADPVTGYPHMAFFYNWTGSQQAPPVSSPA